MRGVEGLVFSLWAVIYRVRKTSNERAGEADTNQSNPVGTAVKN
jgi:hypothetical protein